MPAIVTCPTCARKLRVPDNLLGKKVKCPDCKEPFLAQSEEGAEADVQQETSAPRSSNQGVSARPRSSEREREPEADLPPVPRPPEEDEDYPSQPSQDLDEDEDKEGRKYSGGSVREGWKRVRLGLNLFIYGCYVFIGAYVFLFLGAIVAGVLFAVSGASAVAAITSSSSGAGTGGAVGAALVALVILFISYGVLLVGLLVKIVLQGIGQAFMLRIPNKLGTGQRPMAIAVMVLWGADLFMYLFGLMLSCLGGGLGSRSGGAISLGANCMMLFSYLLMIAWYFVFMVFLRIIARGVRSRNAVGGSIVAHMIATPVFVLLSILGGFGVICIGGAAMFSATTSSNSSAGSAASAGIGLLIAMIVVYVLILLVAAALYIWYVVILNQVRNAVTARLAR